MKHFPLKQITLLLFSVGILLLGLNVRAQSFPAQPIKIVVPFAVGGGVDILTRVLGDRMSKSLGQSVIVENRLGAGGNLGVDFVAKAPADGYTLVMATTGTHSINPALYKKLPFDASKDFAPITLVASVPNLLVVNAQVKASSLNDLIALAKNAPGTLSFASFGNGTSNHLSGEMLKMLANIDVLHVPYKSATQAVTDLIAGQTTFAFVNMPLALTHVKSDKLRALAVTSQKRSSALPELQTMAQAGLTDFVVESWYGLMAPAATPPAVIESLQRAVVQALNDPEIITKFANNGAEALSTSPAEFDALLRAERAHWANLVTKANITID